MQATGTFLALGTRAAQTSFPLCAIWLIINPSMKQHSFRIRFVSVEPTEEEKVITHNKNSRRYQRQIEESFDKEKYFSIGVFWRLVAFMGQRVDLFFPGKASEKFTEELTSDFIQEELNALDCNELFDFNYQPKERDRLFISQDYIEPELPRNDRPHVRCFMLFEYKNGIWEKVLFADGDYKTKDLKEGVVEIVRRTTGSFEPPTANGSTSG